MKKNSFILWATVFATIMLSACGGKQTQSVSNFKEVKIGNQTWLAENLNVDKFRNGDTIPNVKTNEEWVKAGKEGKPAWCYYDNDPANGAKYGKLYNWYAVDDPRGLAPKGWHVASDDEWSALIKFLGYNNAGNILKSSNGWKYNGNGSNSSGFSGLPGGLRQFWAIEGTNVGAFNSIGDYCTWWSSTKYGTDDACYRFMDCTGNSGGLGSFYCYKAVGMSVRCLRD